MAIHLLLWNGAEAPPNVLLDGAIVVVREVAYRVVVTIPARQIAIPEEPAFAIVLDGMRRAVAVVDEIEPSIAIVTEIAPPIAVILAPDEPKVVVRENTSAAETE